MSSPSTWEMGSEFHSIEEVAEVGSHSPLPLPFHGDLYASGRAALISLVEKQEQPAQWWLPEYICPDVHELLRKRLNIRWYRDLPDERSPDFDSLRAIAGDVVIAQDTFGLGDVGQWDRWAKDHPDVTLVEDITHNCTQERFLQSPAKVVFASLRKSLPVADGGIVFRPDGGVKRVGGSSNIGARMKLDAMFLKARYLEGQDVSKSAFRDLQIKGEARLASATHSPCLPHTLRMLEELPLAEMRLRWKRNNTRFQKHVAESDIVELAELLVPRANSTGLFHTVLKFADTATRDRTRQHLIENSVFAAIHWDMSIHKSSGSRDSYELGSRLLTVPTDFRYRDSDVDRLSSLILEGIQQ